MFTSFSSSRAIRVSPLRSISFLRFRPAPPGGPLLPIRDQLGPYALLRARRIVRSQRVDEGVVHARETRAVAEGALDGAVIERDPRAQTLPCVPKVLVACELHERPVESGVELSQPGHRARSLRLAHLSGDRAQLRELLGTPALDGKRRSVALQHRPQGVDLDDLPAIEGGDRRADEGVGSGEPGALQHGDRLAHRTAARADGRRELRLDEALAGTEIA